MDFAIISPTSGLERYATLSKTHLVLTPIYLKDKAYAKFYIERRAAGDFIILDNGAYEGKTMFHLDVMAFLRPQVVVLPDFYLQPWKQTWHAATAFLDMVERNNWLHDVEFCYIPQAEKGDMYGFMRSYTEALEEPRITYLGIPRALTTHIACTSLARVDFARLVRRDRPSLNLHAFGMCNGDVREIPYLEEAGVKSIDSSAPVWRGWMGYSLNKQDEEGYIKTWDKVDIPVNFSGAPDLPIGNHELILRNLEACGVDTRR